MSLRSRYKLLQLTSFFAITCALAYHAHADDSKTRNKDFSSVVAMENAWVSPTQKGQTVGSAYMTLTSKQDATLIKVESNVAKAVEIHSMSMERGVMKMRMLDNLVLSAGTPYQLEPGGLHLMLFDLTTPLKVGGEVEFELTFKNQKSETFKQRIRAKIRTEECANDAHAHHGHH